MMKMMINDGSENFRCIFSGSLKEWTLSGWLSREFYFRKSLQSRDFKQGFLAYANIPPSCQRKIFFFWISLKVKYIYLAHYCAQAPKTGGDCGIFDIISLSHNPIFGWMLNWIYWTYRNIVFPADKLASEELALIFTNCPSSVVHCIKHSHFYTALPGDKGANSLYWFRFWDVSRLIDWILNIFREHHAIKHYVQLSPLQLPLLTFFWYCW